MPAEFTTLPLPRPLPTTEPAPPDATLRGAGLELDPTTRRVRVDGREALLTPSEAKLLAALMRHPQRILSRDELLLALYPRGARVVYKVIDVHIGHVRRKVEVDPAQPRRVLTVRGSGYRLGADD